MKQHLDIAHVGTLGDEGRTDMQFDQNSIAHLMSVLIDLYSDRELAVIREYSTNALDSHIAAHNPDPIQVTLPSDLSPSFVVKDFGLGMSLDTITNFFSKYGASSKRDSDEATGMLGLGCKAGLTYTSQFTVISCHEGLRITVLVTRNSNGAGALQVIDTSTTNEPNGVEVRVPVSNVRVFYIKALEFYAFWDAGTVLVDGETIESVWDNPSHLKLDPDVLMRDGYRDSYLVMGQVPYAIKRDLLPPMESGNSRSGYGNKVSAVVVRVPIGTVDFTPSREQLNYTKRSLEVVEDIGAFVRAKIFDDAQAKVNAAPNHRAAYAEMLKWKDIVASVYGNRQVKSLMYRGSPFPAYVIPDSLRTLSNSTALNGRRGAEDGSQRIKSMTLETFYKVKLFVVGHQGTAATSTTKAKVRKYIEEDGTFDSGNFVLTPHRFGGEWWDETVREVAYEDIKKVVLPLEEREARARERMKYRMCGTSHQSTHDSNEFPPGCVAWVPAMYAAIERPTIAAYADKVSVEYPGERMIDGTLQEVNYRTGGKVAVVLAAEEKRFLRQHPNIPHFKDWWFTALEAEKAKLSSWDWFLLNGASVEDRRNSGYLPGKSDHLPASGSFPRGIEKAWKIDDLMDDRLKDIIRDFRANRSEWSVIADVRNMIDRADQIRRRLADAPNYDSIILPPLPNGREHLDQFKWIKKNYRLLYDYTDDYARSGDRWFHIAEASNSIFMIRNYLHVIPMAY